MDSAHAEGSHTSASGAASHAEGYMTLATIDAAHAEGAYTTASGYEAHAEGYLTVSSGHAAHAEGARTIASGYGAHAEGADSEAGGNASHAEGVGAAAVGEASHAEGTNTTASGLASHAEGYLTSATGDYSHTEGYLTTAIGAFNHAEGAETIAFGDYSHAEGYLTIATGLNSHAEGYQTRAVDYAHAQNFFTQANAAYSHAEGYVNRSNGMASHSEGMMTQANGASSHSEGRITMANAAISHAEGQNTTVQTDHTASHIMGVSGQTLYPGSWHVANGVSNLPGSTGNLYIDGTVMSPAADYAEMFETIDGQTIEPGYFVTTVGEKVRKATNTDDYVVGIVSARPSFIGGASHLNWIGKYETDEWGKIQYEERVVLEQKDKRGEVIVPAYTINSAVISTSYDHSREYVSRIDRMEWVAIGMMGKLLVRDDGTCQVDGYCRPNDEGIATAATAGFRVLARTGANQIKVLVK
ncbi:hypothetical protein BK124_02145 [Paenibacillus amylolyticus]|nr:hypothetical protein BK124_02145 [Paenibacillus amylolyticus]